MSAPRSEMEFELRVNWSAIDGIRSMNAINADVYRRYVTSYLAEDRSQWMRSLREYHDLSPDGAGPGRAERAVDAAAARHGREAEHDRDFARLLWRWAHPGSGWDDAGGEPRGQDGVITAVSAALLRAYRWKLAFGFLPLIGAAAGYAINGSLGVRFYRLARRFYETRAGQYLIQISTRSGESTAGSAVRLAAAAGVAVAVMGGAQQPQIVPARRCRRARTEGRDRSAVDAGTRSGAHCSGPRSCSTPGRAPTPAA